MTEVLVISIYGFVNRYRDGKRSNGLLLMSIIPVITEVGLPFITCGDFNKLAQKLPSYKYFADLGAVEAFQWYHTRFGVMLPPTSGGAQQK